MPNVDLTIQPNEKYRRVIGGYLGDHEPATEYDEWSDEEQHAADEFTETMDSAPSADELDVDESEMKELSWEMLSVSSDPDLVDRMATYFEGMAAHERTERLRAKLRLLNVEDYVNVQVAARRELRSSD